MTTPSLKLGTRGSELALWQAETVRDLLSRECPERDVELVLVKTLGDKVQDKKIGELGRTGVFTAELDRALSEKTVDLAVHSLKDVETTLAPGQTIVAVLPRGPVEDVLVGPVPFQELKKGARIGTGSVRRVAQLKRLRPDVVCVPIRGNVPTRLAKLDAGEYDGLIMARAGLVRLGLGHRIVSIFPATDMLPAVGQGAIAVTARIDDATMARIGKNINHSATMTCVTAERACLKALAGGCNVPLGTLTTFESGGFRMRAVVCDPSAETIIEADKTYALDIAPEAVGVEIAEMLLDRGAAAIMQKIRHA